MTKAQVKNPECTEQKTHKNDVSTDRGDAVAALASYAWRANDNRLTCCKRFLRQFLAMAGLPAAANTC